ncbi:zeaxanthin epoxidase, chloroplastic [Canna indica]|uniref:Zeaxanthin epoxidase, chloroplastic n=1 Tax=Canna indica TaxID=4628 RepID=A0AAQ3JW48_9LILI|nr:zeaxanthin epoxidase, chloroplastic [Canna indica]
MDHCDNYLPSQISFDCYVVTFFEDPSSSAACNPLSSSDIGSANCKHRRRCVSKLVSASGAPSAASELPSSAPAPANLRILIAGGEVGGLVFALAAKRKGFEGH